ncbi:MAG: hypothetical protein Q7V57_11300 [Actinomycetota bacterium]|nr:hypothetical protein [Actinomycetota bacterium]
MTDTTCEPSRPPVAPPIGHDVQLEPCEAPPRYLCDGRYQLIVDDPADCPAPSTTEPATTTTTVVVEVGTPPIPATGSTTRVSVGLALVVAGALLVRVARRSTSKETV